jgi:lysozyme
LNLSDNGVRFIEREEGCVLRGYLDNHGFLTAGVGHLVKPGDGITLGMAITQARADALFRQDVAEVVAALGRFVAVPTTQNQRDSLASFGFNCGSDELNPAHHSVVRVLNAGDYAGAANELLLFDVSAGVHDPILHARRERERTLFLTPEGAALPPEPHHLDLTTTRGIQRALNMLGWLPKLTEDGAFGSHTKAALAAWQAANGLYDDGIPGPKTRAKLQEALDELEPDTDPSPIAA